MKIICHRGNMYGPNTETENNPKQIDFCISKGYDVEIYLWLKNGKYFLGHDSMQYRIPFKYLIDRKDNLWIHCKNQEALFSLNNLNFNYFWHQEDDVTLTSQEFIWAYPWKHTSYFNNLIVLDFSNPVPFDMYRKYDVYGVCVDYVGV